MPEFFAFLVAVTANVVSYYVCKWLDRDDRDRQPSKIPKDGIPWGF